MIPLFPGFPEWRSWADVMLECKSCRGVAPLLEFVLCPWNLPEWGVKRDARTSLGTCCPYCEEGGRFEIHDKA